MSMSRDRGRSLDDAIAWPALLAVVLANVPGNHDALAQARDTVRVFSDVATETRTLQLTEVLTIGQLDGPPEYAFGRLGRMTFGPDLGFYIYDRNDRQIRRYDPRGRFLNAVGRRGSGPGEYQSPAALAISPDSLLTVFDPSNLRVSYFAPNGSLRRAVPLPRSAFSGDGFIADNAGRLYLLVSVPGGPAEGRGSRQQLLRYQGPRLIDSMPVPPLNYGSFIMLTPDGVRSPFRTRGLYTPHTLGGVISASSDRYRLVIDTGGPSVTVVTRNARPLRVQSGELAEWRAYARFLGRRSPVPYEVPDTKPFIRSLTSDHLGRIALPQDSQLMAVRDDRLLLLRKGAGDEDLVSVMRMPRP